jgi:hypothetical protein
VIRIRNRWTARVDGLADEITEQPVQLSDALVTGYECTQCGALEQAAQYLNRRAADFDDGIAECPRCSAPAVRVEIRDTFTVGELSARFGSEPVPAKFVIAGIGSGTVCFDLEET